MNALNKSKIYKKIYEDFNNNRKIYNLKEVEDSSDYDFICTIYGVEFSFDLRNSADMLIIKATAVIEDKNDEELHECGLELTSDTGISFTSYEKTLVLQKVLPLGDYSEEDALNVINKEVDTFISIIEDNKDTLGKESNIEENITVNLNNENNKENFNEDISAIEDEMKEENIDNDTTEDDITIGAVEEIAEAFQNMEQDEVLFGKNNENNKEDNIEDEVEETNTEDVHSEVKPLKEETENKTEQILPEKVPYKRAPEVEEQMRELYKEINSVFNERKKQADYREQTLDRYAERLNLKEAELAKKEERLNGYISEKEENLENKYKQKEEDLENKRVRLDATQQNIDFQWEKLNMEKEMLETEKKNIREAAEINEKTENMTSDESYLLEIDELKNEKESLINENKDLKEKIEHLNINIKALNKSISKKDKYINKLKDKQNNSEVNSNEENNSSNEDLLKENKEMKNNIESLTIKNNLLTKGNNEAQETIIKLEEELKAANSDKEKLQDSYNLEKEQKDKLLKEKEDSTNLDKIKENIKEDLSKSGLNASESKENVNILTGTKNGCNILIYIKESVLVCEKNVKKGSKYLKDINTWNKETINASYTFTDKKVICKYFYVDSVNDAVSEVITRMSLLN